MDDDVNGEEEYSLVMPFVVVQSAGGPLDDEAFVMGAQFGQHMVELRNCPGITEWSATVSPVMLPQYDLLAMRNGMVMASQPWTDAPDDWAFVTFKRVTEE